MFEKNLSYSSLNTARSALSTVITVDGMSIGNHPLVVRFLKGVFNLRPPVPRYKEVWDVSTVLRFLKTLSPVSSLSLKNLSLKLVMLLSLVTAQRGQTLHLLDVNLMSTYDSSIVFAFNKPLKQSTPRTEVKPQGRVVRKPVNANPGLKVNRSINFSCIKMVFASYFLFSLRLFKFKREGQKYKQKNSPKSC